LTFEGLFDLPRLELESGTIADSLPDDGVFAILDLEPHDLVTDTIQFELAAKITPEQAISRAGSPEVGDLGGVCLAVHLLAGLKAEFGESLWVEGAAAKLEGDVEFGFGNFEGSFDSVSDFLDFRAVHSLSPVRVLFSPTYL
jgi:hypothetical protein